MNYNDKLLIISNSVMSKTRANGKTILSYFDVLPKNQVQQLYFSVEKPSVHGYKYFQLSDNDILKGLIKKENRGRAIEPIIEKDISEFEQKPAKFRSDFFRLIREILWWNKWKSKKLIKWLDEFNPTAVFFVGGDSCFAYSICEFVCKRYSTRLSLFITDDYIMPREKDSFYHFIRRKCVFFKMEKCINNADVFFTISTPMKEMYKKIFNKDSYLAVNMTESLKLETNNKNTKILTLSYIGSIYYGRDEVLSIIAKAIKLFNTNSSLKAVLKIFTTAKPTAAQSNCLFIDGASEYGGALNKEEVKYEMNNSDILVFVESFNKKEIEKTRLSLSTKVPEYMSVSKPIFAVGPSIVGSMDYLKDIALCVNDESEIEENLTLLLTSEQLRLNYGEKSYHKFEMNHNKNAVQKALINKVLGHVF